MKNLNRQQAPHIHPLEKITFPLVHKERLNNGIPVHLFPIGDQELVRIDFLFKAGSYHQAAPLIAAFTNALLKEGTPNFQAAEIAELLDFHGAFLIPSTSFHFSSLTLFSLNRHLDKMLEILSEIIQAPTFPEKEVITFTQKKKQTYLIEKEKVKYLASRGVNKALFGEEHPYGRKPEEEDYDRISREALQAFHKEFYTPERCQILVAGHLPANLMKSLNHFFGQGTLVQPLSSEQIMIPTPEEKKHFFAPKLGALQSAIRVARPLFSKGHPDYAGLTVLNTILGGYFGSRLMSNLREEKGYTYGIGSSLVPIYETGLWIISSEVGTQFTHPALTEILGEMRRLREEPIPEEELNMVRNYMLGEVTRAFDGPFQIIDSYRGLLEFNQDFSHYANMIETIKNISVNQLQELACKYLKEEAFYQVVSGTPEVSF